MSQADLGVPVFRWGKRPNSPNFTLGRSVASNFGEIDGRWFSTQPADLAAMRERLAGVISVAAHGALNQTDEWAPWQNIAADAVMAAIFGSSAT